VRSYIQENFKPDDWLAVVALNRKTGEVVQRISPAQNIASSDYQRWLRHLNAAGSDVYLSLNTFQEHAHGRTKGDLKEVRHLYLDLDEDGARKLEAIRHDSAVPAPNYVLNTSPGKFQVIWKVEGFGQAQAEAALRTLAQRFGGDPAATDSTRIFRLPGFNSKKYEKDFQVTLAKEAPADQVYRPEQFNLGSEDPERMPSASTSAQRRAAGEPLSQSERDWSYAIRKLQAGEDPQKIIRDMGSYRSQDRSDRTGNVIPAKVRPYYYAEHTVRKAMAHLGMKPPDQPAVRETDAQPNR
jgi:RepB DNA-primase from phage plasmid